MKIGVVILHAQNPQPGTISSYQQMREMALAAEEGGADSIWVFDHLLYRFDKADPRATTGIWEGWTLLAALAEATNRVELGTLVICSPFRNPALLAKMAHTLDEISDGRLILGVGAGWHKPEFDAFGYDFDHRVDRFEEALQILNPLLKGQRIDFAGSYYRVEDCLITPLGPRPQGIPLLIGARGPRMLRLVARYADQWNTAWLGQPQELAERREWIEEACAATGRDPETLAVTAGVEVSFPDLGSANTMIANPLTGSVQELVLAFNGYAKNSAAHLIIFVSPATLPAMRRLTEAIRLYKRSSG